jgi:hypothetical protein
MTPSTLNRPGAIAFAESERARGDVGAGTVPECVPPEQPASVAIPAATINL